MNVELLKKANSEAQGHKFSFKKIYSHLFYEAYIIRVKHLRESACETVMDEDRTLLLQL